MPTKAYILIETAVGRTKDVSRALIALNDVINVDAVTGPYDIIAIVSSNDLTAVGELVTANIHTIQGIVRTVLAYSWCPVTKAASDKVINSFHKRRTSLWILGFQKAKKSSVRS